MTKRILVILGQPRRASYTGTLAQAYAQGAREHNAEVRELNLGEIAFQPCVAGDGVAALEPDLVRAQADIRWAEHLVFIYPIWWGTVPALLKAFIERTFTPGFAVNFRDGALRWERLLTGRSARLIVTMNTPPWLYRWMFGRPGHHTMRRAVLKFCGIRPVRITEFGPMSRSTEARRQQWLAQVRALGQRGV